MCSSTHPSRLDSVSRLHSIGLPSVASACCCVCGLSVSLPHKQVASQLTRHHRYPIDNDVVDGGLAQGRTPPRSSQTPWMAAT